MKESIENFGDQQHLYGTLCVPEEDAETRHNTCVIMLNAGLVYQAGPKRLYVDVARDLANRGFSSLRFDLSGIGDSDRRRDTMPYEEQIPADIASAISFVEKKTGIESFVLMGICTGADNAHKYALRDKRVNGAVFIDGYAYKTPGYYLRYYGPRVINPFRVARWIKNAVLPEPEESVAPANEVNPIQEKEKEGYFWDVPPRDKTVRELKQLVDRNVRQLHIYTADWYWCFNHQSQFKRMYRAIDFKGLATCVYFPRSDHTYTLIDDRIKLINTVADWLDMNF